MKLNARGIIAIVEVIFYLPSLVLAVVICARHGFGRNAGWLYLVIFTLVRLIGGCCQLATYAKPDDLSLYKTYAILDSIAISPLLLATLGLLSRCVDSINRNIKGSFNAAHFRIVQMVIGIGLILSIAGGTSFNTDANGTPVVSSTTKAGVALYIVAYVAITLMTVVTTFNLSHAELGERRLVVAVILALPLILIRLIYSVIAAFAHRSDFNLLNGSVVVFAVMVVIEQFGVVLDYLVVGISVAAIPKRDQGPILTRPKREGRDPQQGRRGGGRRGGPIHTLIGMGVDAMASRNDARNHERADVETPADSSAPQPVHYPPPRH